MTATSVTRESDRLVVSGVIAKLLPLLASGVFGEFFGHYEPPDISFQEFHRWILGGTHSFS